MATGGLMQGSQAGGLNYKMVIIVVIGLTQSFKLVVMITKWL